MTKWLLLLVTIILSAGGIYAQETVMVPDVTGLNVPQAAAELNRAGLRFGQEMAREWTDQSGQEPDTVSEQSIAPGESAEPGATVDLTVLRSANALVIYDDNDITFVNQTNATINLGNITFRSLEGDPQISVNGARWAPTLAAGDCTQLWSVPRNNAENLPECDAVLWQSTRDTNAHFWTGTNGADAFIIEQDGVERALCPVSFEETRCEFFLAGGAAQENTEYVYLAYTDDAFLVLNSTTDRWMPLGETLLSGVNVGGALIPEDTSPFDNQTFIGDIYRLAPGQCVIYTNNADGAAPPQDCDVIARASVNVAPPIFWNAEFTIQGATVEPATCPGSTTGQITLCIVPR